MRRLLALLLLAPAAAAAEGCPPPPDTTEARAAIMAELVEAPDEMTGQRLQADLWRLYTRAPDQPAQELLDEGMRQRESYDWLGALSTFDRLVAYCPDYAEGWNQRAFVEFLRQDYDAALADLEVALRLAPDHIPARAGLAVTLLQKGEIEAGQQVLRDALALNPWLPERGLLIPVPGPDKL
jgi:tetratricopeptide (TPR) repeat protein